MIQRLLDSAWGQATHLFTTPVKGRRWLDLLVLAAMAGLVMAFLLVAKEWTGAHRPAVEIDLRASALPAYMLLSLVRAGVAYAISLALTFTLAYWAAKDAFAEKLLIPILDILQSVPLLAFLPPVILAMTRVFPRSNIGLELSAALLIVTCMAWNMIFSFYQSLKTVPPDLAALADTYQLNWYQRLRWIELPYAAPGLVWNSMVSVANGWFFLMAAEAFQVGTRNFELPGLGSYMNKAVASGDSGAEWTAIFAVLFLVVMLDRLVWAPLMVWTQRFQMDESLRPERPHNWLLTLLRRSRLLRWLEYERTQRLMKRMPRPRRLLQEVLPAEPERRKRAASLAVSSLLGLLILGLAITAFKLGRILLDLPPGTWPRLFLAGGASLLRVLASTLLATAWTLPLGIWVGLNRDWARRLQPVLQVVASYPFSLLFAAVTVLLYRLHIGLGITSVLLMSASTAFYLLYNIIAGAQAIPQELREMGKAFRITRWGRFKTLYLPAIFPFLVTGWVTATGAAWNASIVTEFISGGGNTYLTFGLGSELQLATSANNLPMVAASSLLMAGLVVLFNRLVWVPLYRVAEQRYTLEA